MWLCSGSRPSKVVHYDDSIVCDSVEREYIGETLVMMKREAAANTPLVQHSLMEWNADLRACGKLLRIDSVHPYTLRHSGPSDDHIRGHRALDEIRKRGRWAVESSAKRYTKAAGTLAQMVGWSAASRAYVKLAKQNIGDVLLRRRTPTCFQASRSERCGALDRARRPDFVVRRSVRWLRYVEPCLSQPGLSSN